jgi:hypothetical protein
MGRRYAASQQRSGLRALPLLAAALVVACGLCLSGCASISEKFAETASQAPQIGLSANGRGGRGPPLCLKAVVVLFFFYKKQP